MALAPVENVSRKRVVTARLTQHVGRVITRPWSWPFPDQRCAPYTYPCVCCMFGQEPWLCPEL